ncbi:MAG: RNA polymerase sigma-70 factor (ECF subfamily) [Candidatus Latescibacterota bacterium]|jgi:RNA polymerase sigma-70 factor (ECF subfamily)
MSKSNEPKLSLLTDESERIVHIIDGDVRAFGDLVRQYYNLAYSLAYKVLDDPSDAEEITQDAFVKIHQALDSFRGDASLKTWIMRIVMRLSLNRRRDRSRSAWRRLGLHRGEEVELSAPAAQTPEAQYISSEMRTQVRRLVDQLPDSLRQVLILNSFEDLSYDEIAQILDIPIGTVSSRLHSARKKLLHQLKERDLL